LILAQTEELYLLGRFQRGRQRLDAIAVFKREGDEGPWSEGKTGYVFDRDDGLSDKRTALVKEASLRWLQM
jgi:hypothetical protein